MFHVMPYHLSKIYEDLVMTAEKQNKELLACEQIIQELSGMSAMDQIVVRLRECEREVIRQQNSLQNMISGLEQVLHCYDKAEKESIDYADYSVSYYRNPEIKIKTQKFQGNKVKPVDFVIR